MRSFLVFSCLLFSGSVFSQQNTDSARIAQLIIDDYKTMEKWDVQNHLKNCANNYTLIEDGEILTLADEIAYYKKNARRLIKRTNSFRFKSISVHDNFGYAVYTLKSDISENSNLKSYNWSESVIC